MRRFRARGSPGRQLPHIPIDLVPATRTACDQERPVRGALRPAPSDDGFLKAIIMTFLRYWLPLIAYCLLIIVQSHFPTPTAVPRWPYFDKMLHTVGYALLGLLFCRAYHFRWPQASARTLGRAGVLSTALFGLSDEIHQYFVPFRSAEYLDVLADTIGGFLGALIFLCYLSYFRPRSAGLRALTSQTHSGNEPSEGRVLNFKGNSSKHQGLNP